MRKSKTHNEKELLCSAGLSPNKEISKLSPLGPVYLPEEHGEYVVRLARALYEDNCANIALAGPYGSGKSSILSKLQNIYSSRCIAVGISTLAPKTANGQTAENENGLADSPLKFDHQNKEGLTNELEREIVGQLLYQGNPRNTPKSSFNRIHPTETKTCIAKSIASGFIAAALALVLIFCADNTSNKLVTWVNYASSLSPCVLGLGALLAIALFSLIAYCIIPKTDGKVRIRSVGAAGASLKLEEGSHSYFDQYLDEIVYFFEANEYDTVIFEDIDRFDNPLIFEELRNLNTLLNKVPGVRLGGRTIHFVYAVRDSIFEAAAIESANERTCADKLDGMVAGSGRVKFFDQIIPVIPFLSELNSFDMACKLFEHKILAIANSSERRSFKECLRIASPLLADMRLLKGIKNEYSVMLDTIGPKTSQGKNLQLTESGILGIAIYKTIFPKDFENIRTGTSWLNDIYKRHYQAIEGKISSLREKKLWCSDLVETNKTIEGKADELGEVLLSYFDKLSSDAPRVDIGENQFYISSCNPSDLWKAFVRMPSNGSVELLPAGYNSSFVKLRKKLILHELGSKINKSDLDLIQCIDNPKDKLHEVSEEISHFAGMDFYNTEDLCCKPTANENANAQTFSKFVEHSAPGPLAAALVLNGFIRKDFRLYSSAYPKEGRAAVINYITNHIQLNAMALDYKLNQQDCAEVVRLAPTNCLTEPRGFNIYILQYLVKNNGQLAKSIVKSACTTIHDEGGALLYLYFSTFNKKDWENGYVLSVMVNNLPDIFERIVSSGLTRESDAADAFAFSLSNIGSLEYKTEGLREWLLANWRSICFSSLSIDAVRSDSICDLFEQSGFLPPRIASFPEPLRHSLANRGVYEITRENLLETTKSTKVISLNGLMENHECIFKHIVKNNTVLNKYLECLRDDEPSLTKVTDDILKTLIDAAGDDTNVLARILKQASKSLSIDDIDPVLSLCAKDDIGAARVLTSSAIQNELLRPSIHNIGSIINYCKANEIDPNSFAIVQLLATKNIFLDCGQDQPQSLVQGITVFIIGDNAIAEEKALDLISKLAETVQEAFPINLAGIPETGKRSGSFLLDLYKINAIGPLSEVFSKLINCPWADKERCLAIAQSRGDKFPIELLSAEDYVDLIFSSTLNGNTAWNSAAEFAGSRLLELDASIDQIVDVVIFFSKCNLEVPDCLIEKLAANALEWEQTESLLEAALHQSDKAKLLAGSIAHCSITELEKALKLMGAPYATIVDGSSSVPKLPNTDSNQAIAKAAKEQLESIISSTSLTNEHIVINKRKKRR